MTVGIARKATQLPEDVGMHIDRLRRRFPGIDEVWAFGWRDAEAGEPVASRGLLLFADTDALEAMRADRSLHREDLSLLVVADGECIEDPWDEHAVRRLSELDWRLENPQKATYAPPEGGPDAERCTAVKVR